jgi:excinuclease ABC subunit C
VEGLRQLAAALNLNRPPREIETFDISHISGTFSVGSMVCAVDGMPRRNRYRRFRIKNEIQNDDPASMAEVIRRRYSRLLEEGGTPPDLILVDGGLTQLRAAREELQKLGLTKIPSAGIAKREEEIYWKDGAPPLRLPMDSAALGILRRIRDEAHRFAITYHRTLRNRRIRESMLDEIEGIGAKRKRLILEHFGSVARLARADKETIAAVPGIGPQMAALIYQVIHGDEEIRM